MNAPAIPEVATIPDEERPRTAREPYRELVQRLSRQSVSKHFDAYADIAWDEHPIDPEDPRFELDSEHVLARTAWYQAQPAAIRARIGLHLIVCSMKVGWEFENVLTRGLLEFALELPDGAPEFRYVYHETIEESQHTLMFAEFIRRSGLPTAGIRPWQRAISRRVVAMARHFPELFFVFVLGGEDPIDHVQREVVRTKRELHPLIRRVIQIHVTEEARHLCFAREYLKTRVPALGVLRRTALAALAPVILGQMAALMMKPSSLIVQRYGIPADVVREAFTDNPRHRERVVASLAKVRALLDELGLVTPISKPIWQRLGIWS